MIHTNEIMNLLIKFTKDSEGKDITTKELFNLPWWRCVWGNWLAQAYYGMNDYYFDLKDVPEGTNTYRIIKDDVCTTYFTNCEFPSIQVMTKELCKSVYGDKV